MLQSTEVFIHCKYNVNITKLTTGENSLSKIEGEEVVNFETFIRVDTMNS